MECLGLELPSALVWQTVRTSVEMAPHFQFPGDILFVVELRTIAEAAERHDFLLQTRECILSTADIWEEEPKMKVDGGWSLEV